jgi:hypothetical protein
MNPSLLTKLPKFCTKFHNFTTVSFNRKERQEAAKVAKLNVINALS